MTELLNKYIEQRDNFLDELLRYHKLHMTFMERQSPKRTADLRKSLKQMRLIIKDMEQLAQARMRERSREWQAAHPGAKRKNKNEWNE